MHENIMVEFSGQILWETHDRLPRLICGEIFLNNPREIFGFVVVLSERVNGKDLGKIAAEILETMPRGTSESSPYGKFLKIPWRFFK